MYDVLDLYEEPYDPKKPPVGLDEKPKQLLGDTRVPISMKPGSPEKYDYEYVRNRTANIFVAIKFKTGKRVTQITKRRTMEDFAQFVKILVDEEYPNVEVIQLVADNLNTQKKRHFMRRSARKRQKGFLARLNSITHQSMQVGSMPPKLRSM
jgi:predicted house-cleaning noncanonical NTP pyrophosphatase (MazG superfamily)